MLKSICCVCFIHQHARADIRMHFVRTFTNHRMRKLEKARTTEKHWFEKVLPKWKTKKELHEFLLNNILHEDDHIIAFNKPCNLSMYSPKFELKSPGQHSNPSSLSIDSVLPYLKRSTNAKMMKEMFSLNRLYSGVVVYAKTQRAVDVLAKYFTHTVTNRIHYQKYRALTVGIPDLQTSEEKILIERIFVDDWKVCIKSERSSVPRRRQRQPRSIISSEILMNTINTSSISRSCSVALVDILPTMCKWDLLQVYLLHKLSPALGDHQYSGRLQYVLGKPLIMNYKDHDHQNSTQNLPNEIQDRLEVRGTNDAAMVPLHIHCYQVRLPKIDMTKGHLSSEKTVIEAPLPSYFVHLQSIFGLSKQSSHE